MLYSTKFRKCELLMKFTLLIRKFVQKKFTSYNYKLLQILTNFRNFKSHTYTYAKESVTGSAKTLHVHVFYIASHKYLIVVPIFNRFILKCSWIICQLTCKFLQHYKEQLESHRFGTIVLQ